MPKGPIRMKVDGSGSVRPGAEPYTWKGVVNGLLLRSVSSPSEASAAGLAVFRVDLSSSSLSIYVIPAGAGDISAEQTLDAYCEEHGIGEAGRAEIEGGVCGAAPMEGEWVVCIPQIASYVVLHRKNAPYALRLLGGKPIHHVTKMWHKFQWGEASRLVIGAEWATFAPHLIGYNAMSQFIERKSNVGSIGDPNGPYPEEAWKVGNVPGDMAANLHPWPIDENGNNRGIITVYRLTGPDASGSYYYEDGPVLPASFDSSASTALTFSGDANETDVYGLGPHEPAHVERNANTADPAAWFGNPRGNPEGEPDLIPVAKAWLPTPSAKTGPYRPGYYYRDGELVMAIAGGNNGLFSDELPSVDVDGYPCLAAASVEGVIKYDWQLLPPTLGPKVMTEQGERFAEAATDRTIRQMWHFSEFAYPEPEGCIVSVIFETIGIKPVEVPTPATALIRIYAPRGLDSVMPVGNAPQVLSMEPGDSGWWRIVVPIEGLEMIAGGYKPGQRVVHQYQVWFSDVLVNVPPRVGEGGAVLDLSFDEYRPYTIMQQ